MAYFINKDDELDAAFVCIVISATTLLNLYAELSQCYTKRRLTVWVNLCTFVPQARLFAGVY